MLCSNNVKYLVNFNFSIRDYCLVNNNELDIYILPFNRQLCMLNLEVIPDFSYSIVWREGCGRDGRGGEKKNTL